MKESTSETQGWKGSRWNGLAESSRNIMSGEIYQWTASKFSVITCRITWNVKHYFPIFISAEVSKSKWLPILLTKGIRFFQISFIQILNFDSTKMYCNYPNYLERQACARKCYPRPDAAECSIWSGSTLFATHSAILAILTLVLLNPDIPCLCKQCRSRSVGFWRSTVCH